MSGWSDRKCKRKNFFNNNDSVHTIGDPLRQYALQPCPQLHVLYCITAHQLLLLSYLVDARSDGSRLFGRDVGGEVACGARGGGGKET